MNASLRIDVTSSASSTSLLFTSPDLEARRAAFKGWIITEYCENRAPAEIVEAAFKALPELRSA